MATPHSITRIPPRGVIVGSRSLLRGTACTALTVVPRSRTRRPPPAAPAGVVVGAQRSVTRLHTGGASPAPLLMWPGATSIAAHAPPVRATGAASVAVLAWP